MLLNLVSMLTLGSKPASLLHVMLTAEQKSGVSALTLSRVVTFPENFQQVGEADLLGIEDDSDDLSVARQTCKQDICELGGLWDGSQTSPVWTRTPASLLCIQRKWRRVGHLYSCQQAQWMHELTQEPQFSSKSLTNTTNM